MFIYCGKAKFMPLEVLKKCGHMTVQEYIKFSKTLYLVQVQGSIKYEPDPKHLRIWLDGSRN